MEAQTDRTSRGGVKDWVPILLTVFALEGWAVVFGVLALTGASRVFFQLWMAGVGAAIVLVMRRRIQAINAKQSPIESSRSSKAA